MNEFLQQLNAWKADSRLTIDQVREAVLLLCRDAGKCIFGQDHMIWRGVQAAILGKHVLIEGMPGEAKTTFVRRFAESSGFRFRRIQFRPDMVPADLIGMRVLDLDPEGKPRLEFREGPLYAAMIVADEINRAPNKVQSAMLETMQERQITRIDRERADTPYHPHDRKELEAIRKVSTLCFDVPLPHPDDRDRVPQVVFATQNPVELEGTYILAEAQTDRFLFYLIVEHPGVEYYADILRLYVMRHGGGVAAGDGADDSMPAWLKAVSLFERIRGYLFTEKDSVLSRFLEEQKGLWHRVSLVISLSHYCRFVGNISESRQKTC